MKRTAIIVAVAAMIAFLLPAPAFASHGNDLMRADNTTHGVDRHSLTTDADMATKHGISQLNRSEINASLADCCDVQVYDAYYGTSWHGGRYAGWAECIDDNFWNTVCYDWDVSFNLTLVSNYSDNAWKSLGCHELGHTVGLGHRNSSTDAQQNSCMNDPAAGSRPNYDTHDLDAINATY